VIDAARALLSHLSTTTIDAKFDVDGAPILRDVYGNKRGIVVDVEPETVSFLLKAFEGKR
jgi:hypothetical protein